MNKEGTKASRKNKKPKLKRKKYKDKKCVKYASKT